MQWAQRKAYITIVLQNHKKKCMSVYNTGYDLKYNVFGNVLEWYDLSFLQSYI